MRDMAREVRTRGDASGKGLEPQVQEAENAPWWMPANLEEMQKELAKVLGDDLFDNGFFDIDKRRATVAQKRRMMEHIIFACVRYEGWREQFARHALLKPFELVKLQGPYLPKTLSIESDGRAPYVIVVPGNLSAEEWNEAHEKRKELADGDWGTELSDTGFLDAVVTIPGGGSD